MGRDAGKKLVTDITYIRIEDKFVYLSAVLDLYKNGIVTWAMSHQIDLDLVHTTVEQLRQCTLQSDVLLFRSRIPVKKN
ncbi:DDE-type integrase/transposase/recombinase [Ectobacillus panaciterrae]|uniref:DDE-type integrase/transposase/recombinase n=1 Tax=Ectobacillus panaciterrae TaxID=363872 RepID=UPI003CCB9888